MISCICGFCSGGVLTHLSCLASASNSLPLATQRNTSMNPARAHHKSRDNMRCIGGLIDKCASREPTDRLPVSVPALGRSPTASARVSAAVHDCSNHFCQPLRCFVSFPKATRTEDASGKITGNERMNSLKDNQHRRTTTASEPFFFSTCSYWPGSRMYTGGTTVVAHWWCKQDSWFAAGAQRSSASQGHVRWFQSPGLTVAAAC